MTDPISPDQVPTSPSWDELHLSTLFISALNNWDYFDAHVEDGPLKDYIKRRVDEHIRRIKESQSDDA